MEYIVYGIWFFCGAICGSSIMVKHINRQTQLRYEQMLKDMKEGKPRIREIKENDK